MPRKTDAERENINARGGISTAKTTAAIRKQLERVPVGQLEQGTIDRAIDRAYSVGWLAGAKDATDGD